MALPTSVQATKRHAGTINTAIHYQGHQRSSRDTSAVQVTVFGTARSPHFSLAIISVNVQLWV